ncbi:hypothetical protein PGB90_008987 [Kerria lacca]
MNFMYEDYILLDDDEEFHRYILRDPYMIASRKNKLMKYTEESHCAKILRFYAGRLMMMDVGDLVGVSKTTTFNIIRDVSHQLAISKYLEIFTMKANLEASLFGNDSIIVADGEYTNRKFIATPLLNSVTSIEKPLTTQLLAAANCELTGGFHLPTGKFRLI